MASVSRVGGRAFTGPQADLANKASREGKQIASARDTKFFRLGKEIVKVTKTGRSPVTGMATRLSAKVVNTIPKLARKFAGPGTPDVRSLTRKTGRVKSTGGVPRGGRARLSVNVPARKRDRR